MPSLKDEAKFYILLKELDAASFKGREEYRKNVALVTPSEEVNMMKLKGYFERTSAFVKNMQEITNKKRKK